VSGVRKKYFVYCEECVLPGEGDLEYAVACFHPDPPASAFGNQESTIR
jgi:hypothetical protein